ncbi:MAG: PAS domain S-box protein [Anaerolineae bacterium]|nr:PAS domain S-box protein [Anaerolineae bacterium]
MSRSRLLLWVVCLIFCLAAWAPRQSARIIRVGLFENSPKIYSDAVGNAAGFWPDLLEGIAATENWNIIWVRCSWNACLGLLEQGQIDLLPDMAWSQERSTRFLYSNEVVLNSWSRVYVPQGSKIESVLDLQGKKVAGMDGSINFIGPESIQDMALRFGIQSTFIEKSSYDDVFTALENHEVDAGVVNKDYGNFNEKKFSVDRTAIIFQPGDLRFAFNRESGLSPLLIKSIDQQLKSYKANPNSVYYRAMETYLGEKTAQTSLQNIPLWVTSLLVAGVVLILFLLAVNLTSRRQVTRQTAQLRASELRQQALLNNIPDMIFRFSKDGVFLDYHAAADEMAILRPDLFLNKNITDVLSEELASATLKYIRQAIDTQAVQIYEFQSYFTDNLHDFEARYTASGQDEVIAIVRDITARKKAERELRDSEQRYQTLANVSPVGIFHTDKNGSTTYINPTWSRISGWSAEESMGFEWLKAVHPEDRKIISENWQKSINLNSVSLADYRFIRPDGSTVWVIGQAVPELNSNNEIVGYVGTITDITDRKQTEEALQRSIKAERAAHAVSETLQAANLALTRPLEPDVILELLLAHLNRLIPFDTACALLLNEDGRLVARAFNNKPAQSMQCSRSNHPVIYSVIDRADTLYIANTRVYPNWTAPDFMGESLSWLGVPLISAGQVLGLFSLGKNKADAFTRQHCDLAEALAAQAAITIQNAHLVESLQNHAAELEQHVAERTAELAGRVSEVEDLNSAMLSLMTDLQTAVKKAESADRLKSAFLATMSHELRTPLNSIIGFTGILLQKMVGPLSPEQEKQLKMVQSSARHLLELINDVLDISKIEADQMSINCETFDLGLSIQKSVDKILPMAQKKGLTLTSSLEPSVIEITSDLRRVEQILLNLLNNAVKFTDQGSVSLTGRLQDDEFIRIQIKDSGIGIKNENLQNLFTPFRQIDTGITRQYEGTGLGLSICKKLVELLGGQIWVESEWGKGSTFSFTLPYRRNRV